MASSSRDSYAHPSPPRNLTLPPHVDILEKEFHKRRKKALNTIKAEFINSSVRVELGGEILRWEPVYNPVRGESYEHYRRLGEDKTKTSKFVKLVNLGECRMTELTLLGRDMLKFLLLIIKENWVLGVCLPDSIAAIHINEVGGFLIRNKLLENGVGYDRDRFDYFRQEAQKLRKLVQEMCDKSSKETLDIPLDVNHFLEELETPRSPFHVLIINHPCLWSPIRFEGFFDVLVNIWSKMYATEGKNVLKNALTLLPSDCLSTVEGKWKKGFEQNLPKRLGSREVYLDMMNSKFIKESIDFKQLDILFFIRHMMVHGHSSKNAYKLFGLDEIVSVFKIIFPKYILELPKVIFTADENEVFGELWEH